MPTRCKNALPLRHHRPQIIDFIDATKDTLQHPGVPAQLQFTDSGNLPRDFNSGNKIIDRSLLSSTRAPILLAAALSDSTDPFILHYTIVENQLSLKWKANKMSELQVRATNYPNLP